MVQCLRSQEKQDWGGSSKFSGLGFGVYEREILLPHSVADEYMAAMKFLSFAQDLNLSSIILEGDFEVIIKALSMVKMNHSPPMVTSSLGHLIIEAKLFTHVFCSLGFCHTCR